MAEKRPPIVKDKPFIQQSGLTGRWYFFESYTGRSAPTCAKPMSNTTSPTQSSRSLQIERDARIATRGLRHWEPVNSDYEPSPKIAAAIRTQFTPSPETEQELTTN